MPVSLCYCCSHLVDSIAFAHDSEPIFLKKEPNFLPTPQSDLTNFGIPLESPPLIHGINDKIIFTSVDYNHSNTVSHYFPKSHHNSFINDPIPFVLANGPEQGLVVSVVLADQSPFWEVPVVLRLTEGVVLQFQAVIEVDG